MATTADVGCLGESALGRSGYPIEEPVGQNPPFLNGAGADPAAIQQYPWPREERRDET